MRIVTIGAHRYSTRTEVGYFEELERQGLVNRHCRRLGAPTDPELSDAQIETLEPNQRVELANRLLANSARRTEIIQELAYEAQFQRELLDFNFKPTARAPLLSVYLDRDRYFPTAEEIEEFAAANHFFWTKSPESDKKQIKSSKDTQRSTKPKRATAAKATTRRASSRKNTKTTS